MSYTDTLSVLVSQSVSGVTPCRRRLAVGGLCMYEPNANTRTVASCHPTPWLSGVALSRLSPDKPVNNRAVILSYRPVLVDRNIATLVKNFLHCRTPLYRLHQLVGLR